MKQVIAGYAVPRMGAKSAEITCSVCEKKVGVDGAASLGTLKLGGVIYLGCPNCKSIHVVGKERLDTASERNARKQMLANPFSKEGQVI